MGSKSIDRLVARWMECGFEPLISSSQSLKDWLSIERSCRFSPAFRALSTALVSSRKMMLRRSLRTREKKALILIVFPFSPWHSCQESAVELQSMLQPGPLARLLVGRVFPVPDGTQEDDARDPALLHHAVVEGHLLLEGQPGFPL